MIKKIRTFTLSLAVLAGLVAAPLAVPATASAGCTGIKDCVTDGSDATTKPADRTTSLQDQLRVVVNVLLFVIGAIAVIMIIIGGIRYVTSNGDQTQLTSAKNTILYAVVGVVIAILAYAIVNFVITQFVK